jgi:hypothetical protein
VGLEPKGDVAATERHSAVGGDSGATEAGDATPRIKDAVAAAIAVKIGAWKDRKTAERLQAGVAAIAALLFILGFIACLRFGSSIPGDALVQTSVAVTAFAVFTAATVVGASLGFLFGLPRPSEQPEPTTGDGHVPAYFLSNSNLIKVSDWLTTIVVGLTLVNLRSVQPAFAGLMEVLESPLGGRPHSGVVGVSLVLIGALVGLVCCYLWTSIQVRNLFNQVESERSDPRRRSSEQREHDAVRDAVAPVEAAAASGEARAARSGLAFASHGDA